MKKSIFVAGHNGMVGSAISRALEHTGQVDILTQSRKQLGLENQVDVLKYFQQTKPSEVYLCAARVGGIHLSSWGWQSRMGLEDGLAKTCQWFCEHYESIRN